MNYSNFYLTMKSIFLSIALWLSIAKCMAQNTIRPVDDVKGLSAGQTAPDFSANDIQGRIYHLKAALTKGPVVLIFIRGQWCPFCNKHLSHLQDSLSLIYGKGATVVVVSPEKSQFIKKTIEKTGAEFSILYDNGYKISDAYDLTFKPDSITRLMYNTALGAKLKEAHSDESERLPVPATFIINENGIIVWRQFDRDYKKRSSINDILNNIPVGK